MEGGRPLTGVMLSLPPPFPLRIALNSAAAIAAIDASYAPKLTGNIVRQAYNYPGQKTGQGMLIDTASADVQACL